MAKRPIETSAPGPGDKKTVNPRNAEIQRRAQMMANRKPVSPQIFFQEAWVELKKTTWPSRAILTKSTTVVLALVAAVGVWVFVLEVIFRRILTPIFNAGH